MNKVTSQDGTAIAYDRTGAGPALVVVNGALGTRADAAGLAAHLAPHFTVFAYDRRGRGASGDTPPYAVEREAEDLAAVISAAGGSAFVYGHSSGAILALEAARLLGTAIAKLALYEPPLLVDGSEAPPPEDFVSQLRALFAAGRRRETVTYWMQTVVGVPAEIVARTQQAPMWPGLEALAHTLPYDGVIAAGYLRGKPLPAGRWAAVTIPTLVMDGGDSPPMMHSGALALTAILPNARHLRFPGQGHGVADDLLVPQLVEFFAG